MSSRYDELERLQRLRESGALTDEEFQAEKRRVLGHEAGPAEPDEGERVVAVEEAQPSRRPLFLVIGGLVLLAAIVAGLLIGRTVGGRGEETASSNAAASAPEQNYAADENLLQTEAPPDVSTLAPQDQLAKAFEAAFGSAGSATIGAPADAPDGGGAVTYTPGRLIPAPFGPVLVSEGEIKDAPHVSGGRIAVAYLRPARDRFAVVSRFPEAVVTGSFGRVGKWSVSPRFSEWPVIVAEGGGTWQGYTCSVLTLTELRPGGPVEVASVPLSYDDSGAREDGAQATSIQGKLINIVKGASFDVVYSGSRSFSEHWVRSGNAYRVAGGKSSMETC